jgi:hypothetical protein
VLGLGRNAKAIPYLVGLTARSETPAPVREAANRALTQIAGKAPSTEEMERFLFRRAQAHYDGVLPTRSTTKTKSRCGTGTPRRTGPYSGVIRPPTRP